MANVYLRLNRNSIPVFLTKCFGLWFCFAVSFMGICVSQFYERLSVCWLCVVYLIELVELWYDTRSMLLSTSTNTTAVNTPVAYSITFLFKSFLTDTWKYTSMFFLIGQSIFFFFFGSFAELKSRWSVNKSISIHRQQDEVTGERIAFTEPKIYTLSILSWRPPIIQITKEMMKHITFECPTAMSIINNDDRKLMWCTFTGNGWMQFLAC